MKESLPAHIRERAIQLSRTMTPYAVHQRLAAEGHKVGTTTVYRWIKTGAPSYVPPKTLDAPDEQGEPDDAEPDLPSELDLDLETLDFRACETLIKDVERYRIKARQDDAVRTYSTLARLELDIRERMHKLRPIKPPDPAKDPANIQARELLFRNLERMIVDAEKRAKASRGQD